MAIARAIVGDASVILADEPTAALDSENGHAVMTVLAKSPRIRRVRCLSLRMIRASCRSRTGFSASKTAGSSAINGAADHRAVRALKYAS